MVNKTDLPELIPSKQVTPRIIVPAGTKLPAVAREKKGEGDGRAVQGEGKEVGREATHCTQLPTPFP